MVLEDEGVKLTSGVATAPKDGDVVSYKWFMSDLDSEDFVEIEGAEEAEYTATEEGQYKASVINFRNKVSTEQKFTDVCRILSRAAAPIITYDEESGLYFDELSKADIKDFLPLVTAEKSDDIVYQWYKHNDLPDDNGDKFDITAATQAANGEYELKESDEIIEGATDREFIPTELGVYFFVATNKYGSTEASAISRFYRVQY